MSSKLSCCFSLTFMMGVDWQPSNARCGFAVSCNVPLSFQWRWSQQCQRGHFSYRVRGAVASQWDTLGWTPLAAVGVGSTAVAVSVLVTPLAISIWGVEKQNIITSTNPQSQTEMITRFTRWHSLKKKDISRHNIQVRLLLLNDFNWGCNDSPNWFRPHS